MLLTTRDENGELNPPLSEKLAEAVSSDPLNTLSSTTIESDRDSGVAIELSSLDNTIGNFVSFI